MPPPVERVARRVGRYLLWDEIAAGGMATVHLGRLSGAAGFARVVAVKRLHPQLAKDPDFSSMFLAEAHLAARLRHANLVSTLDVVQVGDELFVVMEYIEGDSLSRLLRQSARQKELPPVPVIAAIMTGVLHGLHAAHSAKADDGGPLNIVHRDVSPQNLLVGVDGLARVADFGVAKAASQTQSTRGGTLKGKIAYMSPEHVRGEPLDARADMYSAALVLWEALSGRRRFTGDNEWQMAAQIQKGVGSLPSTYNPHVSKELDAVVMRGCAAERDSRFSDALEMAEALQAAVNLASPRAVSAWVARLAHEALADRAQRVNDLTRASILDDEPSSSASSPAVMPASVTSVRDEPRSGQSQLSAPSVSSDLDASVRRRRARNAAFAGIASASALFVCGVALFAGAQFAGPTPAPLARALRSSSGPLAGVRIEPTPAPDSPRAPATPASATPAVPPNPRATSAATRGSTERPKTPSCNPPYVIDEKGKKHFKLECLR